MSFCIFDAHADTISKLVENGGNISGNDCHFDLKRLKFPHIQVFAAFSEIKGDTAPEILKIIEKYYSFAEKSDFVHCNSYDDILQNKELKKPLSMLSIEGGDALCGSIEMLKIYYKLGVRIINLTWNYSNDIASGIMDKSDTGLTPFGESVVKEMNKLGILIDVSHLSEKSFWDVIKITEKPIIASHSNSKKLCSHPRNLNNEQIKEIIKINGCIGLNFYPLFLNDDKKSSIYDIIKHADYILSLGGENSLGFGSDFDGIDALPQGINGVESYYEIVNEFLKHGYKEELMRKICSENFLRVIREVL